MIRRATVPGRLWRMSRRIRPAMQAARRSRLRLWIALCLFWCGAHAELTVVVPEPEIPLQPAAEPLLGREARIEPEEFELTQRLRPLLDERRWQQALTLLETDAATPASAALDLLKAQLESATGDYDRAVSSYRNAIAKLPQFTRAHAGLGTLYLILDQPEQAREHLARALALGATDVQTYAQLGYLNLKLANAWSAVSAYEQALVLEPDNRRWQHGLLTALVASGNFASAGALLDEMLESMPDRMELWQQRANLALKRGDTETAVSSLEAALRLGDEEPGNRLTAAQLHLEHGNFERAADLLSRNIAASAIDVAEVAVLVSWLRHQNQLTYAERLVDAVGDRLGSLSGIGQGAYHAMRGDLASAKGETDTAVRSWRRALELDATNGDALVSLAGAYAERGDYGRALLLYERAELLPPVKKHAMVGRARALVHQGDYRAALDVLRAASSAFPGSRDIESNVQSLQRVVLALPRRRAMNRRQIGRLFRWARWLHLYTSTLCFSTLVFFCVTGIALNHDWYGADRGIEGELDLPLPAAVRDSLALAGGDWRPDLYGLQQSVSARTGLAVPQSIELYDDYGEVVLDYKVPEGRALVTATAEGARIDYHLESALALLNALHRSRDADRVWSAFVDLSAVAMLVFAATGITILFQNPRRRRSALATVGMGVATPILLYLAFVPRVLG